MRALDHHRSLFATLPRRRAITFVPIDFTQAGEGTFLTRAPVSLEGLRGYVAALVAVKQLRDDSAYNRGAKMISAGLTSMPVTFAANVGAEYVDPNETLDILKADGLDALVDGYGVHVYPNANQTPTERTRDFEDLLRPCAAGGRGHPCWLTEWGVRQPNLAYPSDESKRVPLIRETLERIAANVRHKRIGGSYYYDRDDKPIEYAVWRCSGITEAGKSCSVGDAHEV